MMMNFINNMSLLAGASNTKLLNDLTTCCVKIALLTSTFLLSQTAISAECQYQVSDEWNTGYKAEISIINTHEDTGSDINDWQLSWPIEQSHVITDQWNANISCNAGICTATPPQSFNSISSNTTYTLGYIAQKNQAPILQNIIINGEVCNLDTHELPDNDAQVTWVLEGATSSLNYISVKKDHTAEVNQFVSTDAAKTALNGSIDQTGKAILSINLNDVSTGVDIRNSRLLSFLFETELLPTAYITAELDTALLDNMTVGETLAHTLSGEIILHAVRQEITADVLIVKKSTRELSVSTLNPVHIDSKNFDMAAGIETLRTIANLSSIGEVVPVYFHLNYIANVDSDINPITLPEAVNAPSELSGYFDTTNMLANLEWLDNSHNETLFLVRRKTIEGNWITTAELSANTASMAEGLPEEGEYDYKVIAVNNGIPSQPTETTRITVTEGNQLVRGQQLYKSDCAGCHGEDGAGIAGFPALNTERNVDDMVAYIRDYMPQSAPGSCDQQCAEDVATYIQTLWVTELTCDLTLTPVVYGARQLKILTQVEYQNSVEDLLNIDFNAADGLSADTQVGLFMNNTYASVVPSSYSNYLLVAEEISQWVAEHNFESALSCTAFDQDCVDSFIDTLAPKFFRRPLTSEEKSTYQMIADGSHTEGDIKQGLQLALEGLLASPQFLYRHELGEYNPDNNQIDSDAFELTSYEMATFLAYTYSQTTPDQALMDAASRDELRDEAMIIAHATRLASQAENVMGDFVGSWLGTADLALAAKDTAVWTGFDALVPHMQKEINATFAHIMLEPSEKFDSLYNANYTFVNEPLAQHYGIAGVTGDEMQKVETSNRGGILANGAFMARWGEAVETSPILRSVRVRRRMLCQDQPDPPAGTFAAREQKLAELADLLQDPTVTNRTKYQHLTEDAPCSNCHAQYINPLGFGMEDFDTVGRVRTHDLKGNAIDAIGELFAPLTYSNIDESIPFNGSKGLASVMSNLSSAQACLPKQLFRYVTGVGHQEIDSDNPEGTQLSDSEKAGYACAIDELTNTMINDSPRAMFERFGSLDAVRYRKAWSREQ